MRATAHEAAEVDGRLALLQTDPWAVDARDTLERLYAAVEKAEDELHRFVTTITDTLDEAQPPPPRRSSAAASSTAADPGTQMPDSSMGGSLRRSPSLSRILAQQQSLPRTSSNSPRSPVPVHGLAPDQPPFKAMPRVRVDTLQEPPPVPSGPRPTRPAPMPSGAPAAQVGMLFTPVTLPVKAPPSHPAMQPAAVQSRPKPPPPVLGQPVTPLVRAAAPTAFILPGVDIRYGKAQPVTQPAAPRRTALPWGVTSATALPRDGLPYFFENGHPAGWKLVMGDLPLNTDATEARRMQCQRRC